MSVAVMQETDSNVVSKNLISLVQRLEWLASLPVRAATVTASLTDEVQRLVNEERIGRARELLGQVPEQSFEAPDLKHWRRVLAPPEVEVVASIDKDRSLEFAWLKRHAAEYRGKWVAVLDDRLVADGTKLEDVLSAVDGLKLPMPPLLHRLP